MPPGASWRQLVLPCAAATSLAAALLLPASMLLPRCRHCRRAPHACTAYRPAPRHTTPLRGQPAPPLPCLPSVPHLLLPAFLCFSPLSSCRQRHCVLCEAGVAVLPAVHRGGGRRRAPSRPRCQVGFYSFFSFLSFLSVLLAFLPGGRQVAGSACASQLLPALAASDCEPHTHAWQPCWAAAGAAGGCLRWWHARRSGLPACAPPGSFFRRPSFPHPRPCSGCACVAHGSACLPPGTVCLRSCVCVCARARARACVAPLPCPPTPPRTCSQRRQLCGAAHPRCHPLGPGLGGSGA